jgi:GH15 family glucan-1,4-alpha-glucosidase
LTCLTRGKTHAARDGTCLARPETVSVHTDRRQPPIGDYAILGDCRTAALVSLGGSVDWLCLPRFEGASVFAAILDAERGGRFVVRPSGPFRSHRRYIHDSNVLETTFETSTGRLVLHDAMTVADARTRSQSLMPDHELLRRLECVAGFIDVEVLCEPRTRYARRIPRVIELGERSFAFDDGADTLILGSDIPLVLSRDGGLHGRATLRAAERAFLSLTTDWRQPAVLRPLGDHAEERLHATVRWWHGWLEKCSYDGPHHGLVHRSALTLKLLTYPPSGALIAAPTTSLPETMGGERNWDYRYCWLRDAAEIMRALLDLGFTEEGEAFLGWLLHATRLTHPELQVLYDVHGRRPPRERKLTHLTGYRGSRPVRIGNAAADQFQLDVYGEVILAAKAFVDRGGELDATEGDFLCGLGDTVCRRWREPDHGIWERRDGPQQHTHSKAMCWVALDCLLNLAEARKIRLSVPADRLARDRHEIREAIETHGFNKKLGSYVAVFDGEDMDATLLLLGLNGYIDPNDERMRRTHETVRKHLDVNELLRRYDYPDGLGGHEGAFGICSFWETELYARQNRLAEANIDFCHVASFANDVGLFGEEIDPYTGEALGNFPQAFTHVGLINAAASIARAMGQAPERKAVPPGTTRAQTENGPDRELERIDVRARATAEAQP